MTGMRRLARFSLLCLCFTTATRTPNNKFNHTYTRLAATGPFPNLSCVYKEQNYMIFQTTPLGAELRCLKGNRPVQKLYMMAGSRTVKVRFFFSFTLPAEVTPPVTKLAGCPGNQPGENSKSNSG